jgi:hypothetical protein
MPQGQFSANTDQDHHKYQQDADDGRDGGKKAHGRFSAHPLISDQQSFMFQKPDFSPEPSAVSGEGAVGADDTVAGNYDADGITAIGGTHGPTGFGPVHKSGDISVGGGLSEGYGLQDLPDSPLKCGSPGSKGQVKDPALVVKIFIQLGYTLCQAALGLTAFRLGCLNKIDPFNGRGGTLYFKKADGGLIMDDQGHGSISSKLQ